MKRLHVLSILTVWYALVATGCMLWFGKAYADSAPDQLFAVKGVSTGSLDTPSEVPVLSPYPTFSSEKAPKILAKEFALYNSESGKIIYQSEDQSPVPIASTTKVMTAYLTAKLADLDDTVTVGKEVVDQPMYSSLMGLHLGETISVKNLLYGAMLVSGNDAAYALAEYNGNKLLAKEGASSDEKIARFVEEMNQTAQQLGMSGTAYKDPVGINDEGRSTAEDLAKLMGIAQTDPVVQSVTSTALTTVYDVNGTYRYDLRNSNRLITDYQYGGAGGGKTGYTPDAGHCIIATAKRDGRTLTAVILHTLNDTNEASAIEARKLLDAGFTLTQWN